mmetsp:Transcript_426/g.1293  ORF Transcript_426/g.1293 Transcript_426/m.1293 type:complete len:237 (-) Transcript_426:89-799(-)
MFPLLTGTLRTAPVLQGVNRIPELEIHSRHRFGSGQRQHEVCIIFLATFGITVFPPPRRVRRKTHLIKLLFQHSSEHGSVDQLIAIRHDFPVILRANCPKRNDKPARTQHHPREFTAAPVALLGVAPSQLIRLTLALACLAAASREHQRRVPVREETIQVARRHLQASEALDSCPCSSLTGRENERMGEGPNEYTSLVQIVVHKERNIGKAVDSMVSDEQNRPGARPRADILGDLR